jgi:hypothetical protein
VGNPIGDPATTNKFELAPGNDIPAGDADLPIPGDSAALVWVVGGVDAVDPTRANESGAPYENTVQAISVYTTFLQAQE